MASENQSVKSLSADEKRPWTDQHESILVDWADKARCFLWMHERSKQKYRRLTFAFTIPVIILSTLTGTANFGMGTLFPGMESMANIAIGGISITAGIISTLANYFKFAERTEGHRMSALAWQKLYRNIVIELSLDRPERRDSHDFLKYARNEYDRLMESSPMIPSGVLRLFERECGGVQLLHVPEICSDIQSTTSLIQTAQAPRRPSPLHSLLKQHHPAEEGATREYKPSSFILQPPVPAIVVDKTPLIDELKLLQSRKLVSSTLNIEQENEK